MPPRFPFLTSLRDVLLWELLPKVAWNGYDVNDPPWLLLGTLNSTFISWFTWKGHRRLPISLEQALKSSHFLAGAQSSYNTSSFFSIPQYRGNYNIWRESPLDQSGSSHSSCYIRSWGSDLTLFLKSTQRNKESVTFVLGKQV